MGLLDKLDQDYIVAYKGKDVVRVSVLRLLKTACKNFQVEHMRPPTDEDVVDLIRRQCKQRRDSMEQFQAAGRPELVEKEGAELEVLKVYLPSPLEGDELARAVAAAIAAAGAKGVKDMGLVMQYLNSEYKGRIDGKEAAAAVRQTLQKLG
ncbi:MAG: GatB/YqeY domain-containing protein [Desulfovibrio sp.]|jgi:uncharacterized protein YqeY|nr:GatB/YqeY domain-containing protein [Desulfovibrio sp.]